MAVTLIRTWSGHQYEWGYLLRIDLTDGKQIFNREAQWKTEPTQAQVDEAVANCIARVEQELLPVVRPTIRVTCEDGSVVTVEADAAWSVSMSVSLTTQQKNQITNLKPALSAHVRKLYRTYLSASPSERSALAAHNAVFAQIMDVIGE
jgi:hypothetical protein